MALLAACGSDDDDSGTESSSTEAATDGTEAESDGTEAETEGTEAVPETRVLPQVPRSPVAAERAPDHVELAAPAVASAPSTYPM